MPTTDRGTAQRGNSIRSVSDSVSPDVQLRSSFDLCAIISEWAIVGYLLPERSKLGWAAWGVATIGMVRICDDH
jgi:hypothetical protein